MNITKQLELTKLRFSITLQPLDLMSNAKLSDLPKDQFKLIEEVLNVSLHTINQIVSEAEKPNELDR